MNIQDKCEQYWNEHHICDEEIHAILAWIRTRANEKDEEILQLKADVLKWKRIRKPTHGSCCTCQACGLNHDSCRCDPDDVVDDLEQALAKTENLKAELAEERIEHKVQEQENEEYDYKGFREKRITRPIEL